MARVTETASSSLGAISDGYCAVSLLTFNYWSGKDGWIVL